METLHVGYATAGLLAVVLILCSRWIRETPLTEPLLGLLCGIAVGPAVLDLLAVSEPVRTTLLLEATRLLLAVSLISVGLRFSVLDVRSVVRPVTVLVAIGMPLFAAVTAALAAVLLGLPVALAALLGACLSPTDPVLASGVVTGTPAARDLPARLRQLLTEESGANDGLALPLVLIAVAPVVGEGVAAAVANGVYQVLIAVAVGLPLGFAVGKAADALETREKVEDPPELLLTLLLAVSVLGTARLLNSDGILAVFVAALGYNAAVGRRERSKQSDLDEAFNRYLVVPVFLLLGTVLPFGVWRDLGWGAVAFVLGVLLLRRPPVVLALRRVLGMRSLDAGFLGWFGPVGVSALFYLVLAEHHGVADERLFAAGTLAITASTFAHGVTALPGRRLYHHRAPAASRDRPQA